MNATRIGTSGNVSKGQPLKNRIAKKNKGIEKSKSIKVVRSGRPKKLELDTLSNDPLFTLISEKDKILVRLIVATLIVSTIIVSTILIIQDSSKTKLVFDLLVSINNNFASTTFVLLILADRKRIR